jgi:hypothetical protein
MSKKEKKNNNNNEEKKIEIGSEAEGLITRGKEKGS